MGSPKKTPKTASPRQTRGVKVTTPSSPSRKGPRQKQTVKKVKKELTPEKEIKLEENYIVKESIEDPFLWSEESETVLFRCCVTMRPVGPLRHWKMIMIKSILQRELDLESPISTEAIMSHLNRFYNLEELEKLEHNDVHKKFKFEEFSLPKSYWEGSDKVRKDSTSTSSNRDEEDDVDEEVENASVD